MDIAILALLFIKHWLFDFLWQTPEEIKSKAIYGDTMGLVHAGKHGLGTILVILAIFGIHYFWFALVMGVFDAVLHYHIDWAKMRWGNSDPQTPQFWHHLGLDQMAHNFVYLFITVTVSFLLL